MRNDVRQVPLPEDLCAAVEQKFAGRFSSVEELLIFVLQELLNDPTARLDEAEQKIVEERLRELGYI